MREKIILKGGNNNKNSDKKKSGGSDKKKSDGSDKKKCDGSDKKKNSYKKKSGGVNETLINMDIANYEGVIQNKLMSQENATNGDGFQSGFSSSVTGGTMYGGGDAADKKLREILKNLIYDKRDDIINMLKLKFLSFANKLEQKDEDVKTYMDQLKTLFIDNNIEDEKTTTENGGMFRNPVIKMVMKKNSENPFNNIINKLNETIINNIDINNLSKSNIGLFNFIDFDFVITKSTKIDGVDLLDSRPLYILRIIIKYIKDDKNIYVEEIHTFITYYASKYVIVDNNSRFPDKSSTTRIIQTKVNQNPKLNEIYYFSTSYIDNIHKLILYKKKSIETDDTISNNCAKIIYELLKKLSEGYNNKKVVDIEDISNNQDPPSADKLVKIFEEALKNTSIPIKVLTYLKQNIELVDPIAPVAAETPAQVPAPAATPAATPAAPAATPAAPAEAEPEKKNIINLLINKVKECYDPCDTDNIYLNMSTNEFLKNIENYLIRIFNMENNDVLENFKNKLDNFIKEVEEAKKRVEEAKKAYDEAVKAYDEAAQYAGEGGEQAKEAAKNAELAMEKVKQYFDTLVAKNPEDTEEVNKAKAITFATSTVNAAKMVKYYANQAKEAAKKADAATVKKKIEEVVKEINNKATEAASARVIADETSYNLNSKLKKDKIDTNILEKINEKIDIVNEAVDKVLETQKLAKKAAEEANAEATSEKALEVEKEVIKQKNIATQKAEEAKAAAIEAEKLLLEEIKEQQEEEIITLAVDAAP